VSQTLICAVSIAMSPVPIAVMLVLLALGRTASIGVALATGWTAAVGALVVSLVLLVQAVGVTDSSPRGLPVYETLLGAVFLVLTAGAWLRRDRRQTGRLVRAVEGLTTPGSAGLGVVLVVANPKVLVLALGAALALVDTGRGVAWTASSVALFVVISATGMVLPLVSAIAWPKQTAGPLRILHEWLARHETSVVLVVGLVIGTVFLSTGVRQLG
jgi:hypothetical protein